MNMTTVPTIVVDADACPVKREIVEVARTYSLPVLMVASYDHRLQPETGVKSCRLTGATNPSICILQTIFSSGDIVVTQDFGLATIVLARGAIALSPRGQQYDDSNIDYLMERRHEHAKRRRGGGKTKGPKAMSR